MIKIYKKYNLEKDMCDELTIHAKHNGWVVYPEQGGWDLLLVRNHIQVGIQAKLRLTIKLLSQALTNSNVGPHYRAVAVGNSHWLEKEDFIKISFPLKLIFIDMGVHPDFWISGAMRNTSFKHYRHFPDEVVWVPPFVPELDAGIPSPQNVSPWKIIAIKLELLAEEKGWVSIIDVRDVINQEIPKQTKSYPRTLLQSYFTCTKEKDPRNIKCNKWILKNKKPSNQFLYVFEAMKGKKNA
jgi:hypothetical protein